MSDLSKKAGLGFFPSLTNTFSDEPDLVGSYQPSERLRRLALKLGEEPGFYALMGYDPNDSYSYTWGVYEEGVGYHYDLI